MKSTDAVAVALADTDSVIDKMELDTTKLTHEERTFLAAYQSALGSGTTKDQDMRFLGIFKKFFAEVVN